MWTAKKLLTRLAKGRIVRLEDIEPDQAKWSDILDLMDLLERRYLAETLESGRYRITEEGRKLLIAEAALQTSPRLRKHRRTMRQRAWWLIRKDRKVSLGSLLATIASDPERQASNLREYLTRLTRVGILIKIRRGGGARYVLINDIGPIAPVARRDGSIYNPNNDTLLTPVGEEATHG